MVGAFFSKFDNIFIKFGGQVFQQTVDIPMGTNYTKHLADIALLKGDRISLWVSYQKQKKLAHSWYSSFPYIDDVLSPNNSHFGDFLHLMYPSELEIKDARSSLHLTVMVILKWQKKIKYQTLWQTWWPWLTNLTSTSHFWAAIWRLYIQGLLWTQKLLNQGHVAPKLQSSLL